MRVAFGRCTLDTSSRELTVGGELAHLPPKMFNLLEVLLDSQHRAISKSELHERLWKGTFVSDAALSTLVADLRRAIGEDGHEPHLIRTVYGFGYAFSGQVSILNTVTPFPHATSPICHLTWNSREIVLCEGEHIVGRARESGVWIDDPTVSRRHARITIADGVTLKDLGSKNGTYLNERCIEAIEPLKDGDRISVGPAQLVCQIFCSDGPTLTQLS